MRGREKQKGALCEVATLFGWRALVLMTGQLEVERSEKVLEVKNIKLINKRCKKNGIITDEATARVAYKKTVTHPTCRKGR
jgi:hypothetical protein